MNYRKDIDGLRGIAISLVILSHSGFAIFSGGFIGVDVFFVISGFLITKIILMEISNGTFSFIDFYERRARRILPALSFVILLTILPALIILMPNELVDYAESLIATPLFLSNILFWLQSGYFEPSSELKPLLHTWSLAVEEQFYLLFPILFFLLFNFGRKIIFLTLLIIFLISISISEWGSFHKPWPNFYLLPSRAWELLLGSFGAIYFNNIQNISFKFKKELFDFFSILGVLLIILSLYFFEPGVRHPSLLTLFPTLGSVFILLFYNTNRSITYKLLSNKVLVNIGLVSYSAYLFHHPIFAFFRYLNYTNTFVIICLIFLTLFLSFFSYKFIEQPFRDRKRITTKKFLYIIVSINISIVLVGTLFFIKEGYPNRLNDYQISLINFENHNKNSKFGEKNCLLIDNDNNVTIKNTCLELDKTNKKELLLWGDSFAEHYSETFENKSYFDLKLYTSGCPPFFNYVYSLNPICKIIEDEMKEVLKNSKPSKVVLSANWFKHRKSIEKLEETIKTIRTLSKTTKIVLFGNLPQWHPSLPQTLARINNPKLTVSKIKISYFEKLNEIDIKLREIAEKHNVLFVSLLDLLCESDECISFYKKNNELKIMAYDYGHLTSDGAEYIANLEAIRRILVRD